MRALIVESDKTFAHSLALMLRSCGASVETVDLDEEVLFWARNYDFDVIVMGTEPRPSLGLVLLRQMRTAGATVPVVAIGTDDERTCVNFLQAGADDYLRRPFHCDELVARCQAVVRRWAGLPVAQADFGDLRFDLSTKTASIAGTPVHLTGKEAQLFELLVLRAGRCVTKQTIMEHLYGQRDEPGLKIIDVFICKLRNKFRAVGDGRSYLETVWGRGYTLPRNPPDDRVQLAGE